MSSSPHYDSYFAKNLDRRRDLRKLAGSAYRRLESKVYDTLLCPYGAYRHAKLLNTTQRVQTHTYTCFLRAPSQLKTICGPVMEFLGNPQRHGDKLDILLMACSLGAEAYTLASWLRLHLPNLDFHIHAPDLHQEMVERASQAEYRADEALHSDYITREFVDATFQVSGDRYTVRPEVREKASFVQADLLDGEALRRQFSAAPMVVAQNVLFHLDPPTAAVAFDNLVSLMAKPRSVLLVEGMDLDLRTKLTQKHGLAPLTAASRSIHTETRTHTPKDWWNYYWGTEPYQRWRPDRDRRYATIFLKGDPPPHAPRPSRGT